MPRNAIDPKFELRAHQRAMVEKAVAHFVITGCLSTDMWADMTAEGLDPRAIIDGCIAHPQYQPVHH
jgi:uncharacterized phage-like protein YoqJ